MRFSITFMSYAQSIKIEKANKSLSEQQKTKKKQTNKQKTKKQMIKANKQTENKQNK